MQAGYTIVQWVMACIEYRVPWILIQQRFHPRNVCAGDFNIEEQIVRDCKDVNKQIIQCDFVGQITFARIHVVNRRDVNDEEVNEQVMEIEEIGQNCILERVLDDEYQFPLKSMNPVCKVPSGGFDGFIQPISYSFPNDDDEISKNMEVIPFIPNFIENSIHWDS